MRDKMIGTLHIRLEEFYEDYFGNFSNGSFFE